MLEPSDITLLAIDAFERLQIPYMVCGSFAAAAHGVRRASMDADLVVQMHLGDGRRFAAELGADFYTDADVAEEAIRRQASFSAIYLPQTFKLDFFVLPRRSYDVQAFARRLWKPFGLEPPRSAFVESPEDVILAKLKWYRLGGEVSDMQWRDVLGVLKLQAGRLDEAYLRHWAAEEKVLDLLERAMQDAR